MSNEIKDEIDGEALCLTTADYVALAMDVAARAHYGQKDKDGHPYIDHSAAVAVRVSGYKEKAAAWLHDVIGKTSVTIEDLRWHGFPESIVQAVDCLTWKKDESRRAYLRRVKENRIARKVKCVDLLVNGDISGIENPTSKQKDRHAKYYREYLSLREAKN